MIAKPRDVDASLFSRFKDRLALPTRDLDAIDGEGEVAHLVKSLS